MDADDTARAADRALLIAALKDQDLLPPDFPTDLDDTRQRHLTELTLAVERFLARSPSRLMMINLDDVFCESDQLNLPGTTDAYPNWRRKVSKPVESLDKDVFLRAVCSAVADERRGEASQADD